MRRDTPVPLFLALSASAVVHLALGGVAVYLAMRPVVPLRPVFAVELVGEKSSDATPLVVEMQRPRPRPGRIGAEQPGEAPLDTLARSEITGTLIGDGRPRPNRDPMAGDDTAALSTRVQTHPTLDVQRSVPRPSRHVAVRRPRRPSPDEEPTPFMEPGASPSGSDPAARRHGQPGLDQLARASDGQRSAEAAAPQRRPTERLSRIPLAGTVPDPPSAPKVPAEISSRRLLDLMDAGRPHDRGWSTGRGRGSTRPGRQGAQAGGDSNRPVWLSTPDRRYVGYFRKIYRKVQPLWRFPKGLEVLLEQGDVLVQFTILSDGQVSNVQVRKSSGYDAFDSNVVAAIQKAAPFEPIPSELGRRLHVLAPFEFSNPIVP